MKNLVLKAFHVVPLYDQNVTLYVSRAPARTYRKLAARFNSDPGDPDFSDFDAITMSNPSTSEHVVIFTYGAISENSISHEVKHLVDYINDTIGKRSCRECRDEPTAYLTGYLASWIKKKLKSANLKVT